MPAPQRRDQWRRLLRPSWLVLHVLGLALLVALVRLGTWQWGRGEATGSLRSYSYGLEWWALAALSLVGYVKYCLDETREAPAEPSRRESGPAQPPLPPQAPVVLSPQDEDDPEVAAWNARFAELARRDAERSR